MQVAQLALSAALEGWRPFALAGPLGAVSARLSWVEQHSGVLFPILAVATIALLALGIVSAWRTDGISGELKLEYKRQVLTTLRAQPAGCSIAKLAKELDLSVGKTAGLVEEMAADHQVVTRTHKGVTTVRARLGPDADG